MTLPFFRGDAYTPSTPQAQQAMAEGVVQDRLSVNVDHPDGTGTRWGADEVDAGLIPGGLSFSTSMPGGFKAANCTLARALRDEGTEGLFHDLTVLGPGQDVAWEGRLDQMPRSSQEGGTVTPQAVGHAAMLDDRKDFREVYVDRTHDRWGPVPMERRQSTLEMPFRPTDGTTNYTGENAVMSGTNLRIAIPGYVWSSLGGRPLGELWYDGGGIPIGSIHGNWYSNVTHDPTWVAMVYSASPYPSGVFDLGARFSVQSPSPFAPLPTVVPLSGRSCVLLQLYYQNAPAGNADTEWYFGIAGTAVMGTHGLPTTDGGVLASDVLGHALPRVAPGLRFTTGPTGTIVPTDFPIRHLVFADLSNGTDVVQGVNAYHQWEWAVWEDRTFYFHPTGSRGREWRMPTGARLQLAPEGDKSTNIYTGVVVQYQDYAGRTCTVGPPGSSTEATDPLLRDTNPGNPAVAAGVSRVGVLQLTSPATLAGATKIGQVWLLEQSRASRAGTAQITYSATDDAGNLHPAYRVRAGDRLVVTDRPGDPPRTIIETAYDHSARTVNLTLDNTAARVDALMQRIGASVVGVL